MLKYRNVCHKIPHVSPSILVNRLHFAELKGGGTSKRSHRCQRAQQPMSMGKGKVMERVGFTWVPMVHIGYILMVYGQGARIGRLNP